MLSCWEDHSARGMQQSHGAMPCALDLPGLQLRHLQLNSAAARQGIQTFGSRGHKAWSAKLAVLQKMSFAYSCAACSGGRARGHNVCGAHTSTWLCCQKRQSSYCVQGARAAALEATNSNGGRIPPFPGLRQRIPSSTRLSEMGSSVVGSPGTSGMPAGGDARGQPAPASRLRRSSGLSEDGHPMAGTAELQQGGPQGSLLHQQVCCLVQRAAC